MTTKIQHRTCNTEDVQGIYEFIKDADVVDGPEELYAIVQNLWPELLHKVKPPAQSDALMRTHTTQHPTKQQYLQLAQQCDDLAVAAKSEIERREYRNRADLWRRLAGARLPTDAPERHFARRSIRKTD
jgi:hypothetical protein